jgi:hypothetical protein
MEFVVLTTFMILFFIIVTIGIQNQMLSVQLDRNEELARQVANVVNEEALLAAEVNPGYTRTFVLPVLVDGSTYNLSLYGEEDLVVGYRGQQYLFFMDAPVRNLTPLGGGENVIYN